MRVDNYNIIALVLLDGIERMRDGQNLVDSWWLDVA
jgi:hypothetical protein